MSTGPRIAVLGNSHAACLKSGADLAPIPGLHLTFFAARADGMADLAPSGGRLMPGTADLAASLAYTSGGHTVVDPAGYDGFLLVSLGLRAFPRIPRPYSRAALARGAEDHARNTLALLLVDRIRSITDRPIHVMTAPLLAATGGGDPGADTAPYLAGAALVDRVVLAPRGAVLLAQPVETIVGGFFTDRRWSVGSRRLDLGDSYSNEPHPQNDRTHMNAAFGALVLADFAQKLGL